MPEPQNSDRWTIDLANTTIIDNSFRHDDVALPVDRALGAWVLDAFPAPPPPLPGKGGAQMGIRTVRRICDPVGVGVHNTMHAWVWPNDHRTHRVHVRTTSAWGSRTFYLYRAGGTSRALSRICPVMYRSVSFLTATIPYIVLCAGHAGRRYRVGHEYTGFCEGGSLDVV